MEEKIIKSVSEYINIIQELDISYPSHGISNNPTIEKFLYRGIGDVNYPLLPCIFRKSANNECYKYLFLTTEESLLKDFASHAAELLNIPSANLHRWAEYAQHFGVPTRLLDWTSNPLVALYFACSTNKDTVPAIWILHRLNYYNFLMENDVNSDSDLTIYELITLAITGQYEYKFPIVYRPHYVDQRMGAQSSFFMAWGSETKALEDMIPQDCYMKLSNKNKNTGVRAYGISQNKDFLISIKVSQNYKSDIIRQLDVLGINSKTLFPGLDGIGKYIEGKYKYTY